MAASGGGRSAVGTALSPRGGLSGAAAVTRPAVAGTVAVRAGAVAVTGLRRAGERLHERQTGAGKAKGGKKLSACHGGPPLPTGENVAPAHASGVSAEKRGKKGEYPSSPV